MFGRQGTTAEFVLINEKPLTNPLVIRPYSLIEFDDANTGALLFGGVVNDPYLVISNAMYAEWYLDCIDYTTYADNIIVSYGPAYDTAAGDLIQAVTVEAQCGIAPGFVAVGPTVAAIQILDQTLTEAWNQIGDLASWQGDYNFRVDYQLNLWWGRDADAPSSGVFVTDAAENYGGAGMNFLTTAFIDPTSNFKYEWDGTALRNRITVRGSTFQKAIEDTRNGDGVTTAWPLSADCDTNEPVTVSVAGTQHTVQYAQNDATVETDFAIVQAPSGLWFLLCAVINPSAVTGAIVIDYTGNIPVKAQYDDTASQATYNGPNNGVFQEYIGDSSLLTVSAAYQRARAEAQQYSTVQERFTFTTTPSFLGHMHVGQTFTFNSQYILDSQNAYLTYVNATFIIIQCRITGVQGGYRSYEIIGKRLIAGQGGL